MRAVLQHLLALTSTWLLIGTAQNATTTMTMTTTTTVTSTITTTVTTVQTFQTTAARTTGAPTREVVKGSMKMSVPASQVDAFVRDPDVIKGVEQGIALVASCSASWITASLSKVVRRLQMMSKQERRLTASNVKVDYTINIPEGASSSVSGTSMGAAISSAPTTTIESAISAKVAQQATTTYSLQVTEKSTPTVEDGPAATTIITTLAQVTTERPGSSSTPPKATLSAALLPTLLVAWFVLQ